MKLELKPCPFCGKRLVLHSDHHGEWWQHHDKDQQCYEGQAQIHDEDDAKAWNCQPAIEARDALLRVVRECHDVSLDCEWSTADMLDMQREIARLKSEVARLRKALGDICQHQKIVAGSMVAMSKTYAIAVRALKQGEESSE